MDATEILSTLLHPVIVTDHQQAVCFLNERAWRVFGLTPAQKPTLAELFDKLCERDGSPLDVKSFTGQGPIPICLHCNELLKMDALLHHRRLADGGQCYEIHLDQGSSDPTLDALTGLMERGQMFHLIDQQRQLGKGALILIDIDRLKIINDFLGYATGDEVIHALGQSFRQHTPEAVMLARWSGHEFMALVPSGLVDQTPDLARRFNVLAHDLPLEHIPKLPGGRLSLSIGYTRFDADDHQDPLTQVNSAVYEAKRTGRNRAIDAQTQTRPSIYLTGGSLESALAENRIVAAIQPIFDLRTGAIVADESLARMITPDGKIIVAGEFIEAASSLQLAHRIDQTIIRQTINYCVTSHFRSPRAHFVNISGDFLRHPELIAETIRTAMDACACTHPDQMDARLAKPLVIEITERELVDDTAEALSALQPLIDFGLRLALDDFGSGYSSYRYLLDLPFSFLKIEGELVRHIATNQKARRIVQHIQDMAKDLGLITVAEYISDRAIADALVEIGVDWGQGFYLGRPELMHPDHENRIQLSHPAPHPLRS
jgi:diguanylate cyclase (GGDEF)-like protein